MSDGGKAEAANRERDTRVGIRAKSTKKSLWRFGVFTVTKSLHFTGFGPVSAERKAIHTPIQPDSLARKAWWG